MVFPTKFKIFCLSGLFSSQNLSFSRRDRNRTLFLNFFQKKLNFLKKPQKKKFKSVNLIYKCK